MTTEEGEVLGSEPDDTELRLCMEDKADMAERPEAVERVIDPAGLRPTRIECRLLASSLNSSACGGKWKAVGVGGRGELGFLSRGDLRDSGSLLYRLSLGVRTPNSLRRVLRASIHSSICSLFCAPSLITSVSMVIANTCSLSW